MAFDNASRVWNLTEVQLDSKRGGLHTVVVEDSQPNQGVQEEQLGFLGRGILELMSEALSLKHSQRVEPIINPRLHGMSHIEMGSGELNP